MKKLVDRLIYPKDKASPETYQKGKFFVVSTMVFLVMCMMSFPYYFFVSPESITRDPAMFYANIALPFLVLGLFIFYKKFGKRILLANVITLFGWLGNIGTYESNGGIFSPDNIWGIIISSWVFLVADKISGTFWFIVIACTLTFFYYADLHGMGNFWEDTQRLGSHYFYFNSILAVFFLLTIVYLYESSKDRFVKQLKTAKAEIESNNKALTAQKEDILASISYAKKIQHAVLPAEETIHRGIPLSFILYRPRDIVSGDFFWYHEIDRDMYMLVAADCTGHGVPGAFMTVVGSTALAQVVTENHVTQPRQVLHELDKRITSTLRQEKARMDFIHDGMDLSLVRVDRAKKEFTFTSAKRPAFFIPAFAGASPSAIRDLKGSRSSIGGLRSEDKRFDEITVAYEEDDTLYLFTDGIVDQFGGPENKKFTTRRFRELLLKIHHLPVADQKQRLAQELDAWKGNNEQTDDMLVIGIRL